MYHQVSTFHCNWYESTSATATPQPNVSQWIFPGPPFRLLLRLQQLLSSSEGPLTGSHLKKKQTSEMQKGIRVREAIRFPISRWFAAFLVVGDSQQSPQGLEHPKRHLKKKVLPGPFGCLMMLAARFYPPGESTAKKSSARLFRKTTIGTSSISITAWLRFAKSLAKFCSCAAFFSVVGFHVLRCPAFGSTTYTTPFSFAATKNTKKYPGGFLGCLLLATMFFCSVPYLDEVFFQIKLQRDATLYRQSNPALPWPATPN